jgi:hypothetical protein
MSQTTSQATTEGVIEAPMEGPKNSTQGTESTKVYTQTELDAITAAVKNTTERKIAKRFEGVDVEQYRALMQKEEELKLQQAKEKGEFEKILKDQADKANQRISTLTQELTKVKVDGTLLNAASSKKAINPEQVAKLIRDQIKMSETGEVEVVDPKTGRTKYTEKGDPYSVELAVEEFLRNNPHFVTAGPSGSGSRSNTGNASPTKVDINSLDMKNPEHRKVYAQYRKDNGIS